MICPGFLQYSHQGRPFLMEEEEEEETCHKNRFRKGGIGCGHQQPATFLLFDSSKSFTKGEKGSSPDNSAPYLIKSKIKAIKELTKYRLIWGRLPQ